MSFNEFLNQAWNDHAKQAAEVASRLDGGMKLIEKNDQVTAMARLVTQEAISRCVGQGSRCTCQG